MKNTNSDSNKRVIQEKTFENLKINNMYSYLQGDLFCDMEEFRKGGKVKSGYENIDAITSLYPGLYVIGAITSLGKTTFMQQMADQLAKNGEHVLYFSLEQSTLELATKSLSRIMKSKVGDEKACTSLQISKMDMNDYFKTAVNEYMNYTKNLTIIECSFRATIDDIVDFINSYIETHNEKPIVIVDYLQVIQAPIENHMSTKDLVDMNVRRLKQIQSDNKLILFVISSINRQNYINQLDFESFKESGGIEYTADVMWGLQLQCLHDDLFYSQGNLNDKHTRVREAKTASPRKIELICLKNRFGISSYSCKFYYYPKYDYFKADMTGLPEYLIEENKKDCRMEVSDESNYPDFE